MKRVLILFMSIALSGCVTTTVIKEVQIKKDANGKVTETTETERTIQQGIMKKGVELDYLKNKQSDTAPATIYY